MTTQENVALLQEMLTCDGNIYTWRYDGEGQLLNSNCPQEALLDTTFSLLGCKELVFAALNEQDAPVLCGTAVGLVWGASCEKLNGKVMQVYVIGPVQITDATISGIERALKHYSSLNISLAWKNEFLNAMKTLPFVSNMIFTRYTMQLHYGVTARKVNTSEVVWCGRPSLAEGGTQPVEKDRNAVWHTEQALLRMVRDGDLNYQQALHASSLISNGVPLQTGDPLRQLKTSLTVFISLCTRASIEGGLSPEQAYSLGDSYIQSVENSASLTDMAPIANMMYEDFIRRVHSCRTNPQVSRQVQKCCNYIEAHLEEKLSVPLLARQVGYTEYYLSRKFKAEMNCSITNYIKFARMERAKLLLTTTENSVQDIADRLNFGTRSYFTECFHKVVGHSPVEYRSQNKRI